MSCYKSHKVKQLTINIQNEIGMHMKKTATKTVMMTINDKKIYMALFYFTISSKNSINTCCKFWFRKKDCVRFKNGIKCLPKIMTFLP